MVKDSGKSILLKLRISEKDIVAQRPRHSPATTRHFQNTKNNVKYHMNIWTPNLEIHQKLMFSSILSHIPQNTNQTLSNETGTSKTT